MNNSNIDKDWDKNKAFDSNKGAIHPPRYPREFLVKVLSSSSYTGFNPQTNLSSKRVLEIGAFGGNNLRFCHEKGSNLDIPFENNFFDLIISVSTIHYCVGKEIKKALKLWKSKLKRGGRIYIETAGPTHDFVLDSNRIDKNKWIWGKKSGFRSGKYCGFFDSESHWETTLKEFFPKVSTGRVMEKGEFLKIDSLCALCEK